MEDKVVTAYCPRCKSAQLHVIAPVGPKCKTCLAAGRADYASSETAYGRTVHYDFNIKVF